MDKRIKLLVMDVDGTLTDGKIYISSTGELMKAFNVKDGYAIAHILKKHQIMPTIITGRNSEIVEYRAKELGIDELHQGVSDKLAVLEKILKRLEMQFENVAYIGDDINDIDCMKRCGVTACPIDAVAEVKNIATYICHANGGNGAVREFVDWLIKF